MKDSVRMTPSMTYHDYIMFSEATQDVPGMISNPLSSEELAEWKQRGGNRASKSRRPCRWCDTLHSSA